MKQSQVMIRDPSRIDHRMLSPIRIPSKSYKMEIGEDEGSYSNRRPFSFGRKDNVLSST